MITENLYCHVDNFNISIITNGLFSKDVYTIFLHPWLCRVISGISWIFPIADAYTLLMHLLLIVALCMIFSIILKTERTRTEKILLILVVFTTSFAIHIWNINYTVQAAFFVMTGYTLLLMAWKKKNCFVYFIGVILICFGFMWRIEGALLTVPFICLDIVVRTLIGVGRRVVCKRIFFFVIPIIFVMLLITIQLITKNLPQYKEGVEYNSVRTAVEDFPVKSWDNISESIESVSKSEYDAARSWMLFDTDVIDTELFTEISRVGSINRHSYSINGLMSALKEMMKFVITRRLWSFSLGAIILLSFIALLMDNKRKLKIAEGILVVFGGGIILLYYTIRGRAVDHVWISVILIIEFIMMILLVGKNEENSEKRIESFVNGALIMVCLAGTALTLSRSDFHVPQFAFNSRVNNYVEQLTVEYDENDLYIWDNWHRNITQTYMSLGKLPTQEFINHNMAIGDWTYGSSHYLDYLSDKNAKNPAKALLERPHTYLVSDDCSAVLNYMREHYGDDICASKVDNIGEVAVWKFYMTYPYDN